MAEIIRPFVISSGSPVPPEAPKPAISDSRVASFRSEIEKLEAQRTEILKKYEDARRAFEKQNQLAVYLEERSKRNEQRLIEEQEKTKRSQELIASYQKQWEVMVENDKKLRNIIPELQHRAKSLEQERQRLRDELSATEGEVERLKVELTKVTRNCEDLSKKYHTAQEEFIAAEKQANEHKYNAAMFEQELEGTKDKVSTLEQNQSVLRNNIADARFRVEQLRRELEMSNLRGHEFERVCQETLAREERCRAEIATLNSEIADLSTALKLGRDTQAAIQEKLNGAEHAYNQLMQDRLDLVRRGDEAYAEATRLKKMIEEMREQEHRNAEVAKAERDQALQTIANLETQLLTKTKDLEFAAVQSKMQVESLTADSGRLKELLLKTEQKLESEKELHQTTRQNLAETERVYNEMLKDKADLIRRGDEAYAEVARLNRKLEETVAGANEFANSLKMEREGALKAVMEMEFELGRVRSQLRNVEQEKLESACAQDAMQSAIKRLEQELHEARSSAEQSKDVENRMREELQQAQILVQQLTEGRSTLVSENDKLLNEFKNVEQLYANSSEELRLTKAEMRNLKAALSQALTFSPQIEQDRARLQQELLEAKRDIERVKLELSQTAQKSKVAQSHLSKKVQTEETAKNALWDELVKAERAMEQAKVESTRYRAEIEVLHKSLQHGKEEELLSSEISMIQNQELRAHETDQMRETALKLRVLAAEAAGSEKSDPIAVGASSLNGCEASAQNDKF